MKKVVIFYVLVIAIILCLGTLITGFHQESNPAPEKTLIKSVENPLSVSGEQINVFSGMFGNITIDTVIPNSSHDMRIYRGYFRSGDLMEYFPGTTKAIKNPIPEDQAPEFAKRILESQYGGLPSDAQLQYSFISYTELMDPDTLKVIERVPYETFVSWHRTIDGMRIEGGSDIIQVTLGENGDLIHVNKRWRTYEPLGNVSIISARKAIDKLGAGEVLNPGSSDEEDVSIYDIHLSYYVDGIDKPEITLEPIWVFYGNTTTGHHVPFFIYARQFANFTATQITGKVPLTITFIDTSDAGPTKWHWDFGDGTNSTEQNPAHAYTTAGTYNVTLIARNDLGSDWIEKPGLITVYNPAPPVANFTASPVTGSAPLNVSFTDLSENGPVTWNWTFGDGDGATVRDPVHTFPAPGNYTVSLNVTNEDGTNSIVKPDYISITNLPPTTVTTLPTTITTKPTATVTTTVTIPVTTATTRPTPSTTHAPLPVWVAVAGIACAALITRWMMKPDPGDR
jgi:PKD repeat protein